VSTLKKNLCVSASLREPKKSAANPALVPKLRFPEFRDKKGWKCEKVDDLVDTVTPPKKLPTSNYSPKGAFPIIDQSQADICGWTDDDEALIQEGLPLIVFGDHTCILKLIDRPFAQGADGIKILKTHPKIGTPYLYQFLSYRPVVTEEYKRHYSILKEKLVFFPDFQTAEQCKIAECLSSVDELIGAESRKLDALKTHKKGLMQQLFPREGEPQPQPRLRFPEFRNDGEWEPRTLGSVCSSFSGGTPSTSQPEYYGGDIPFIRSAEIARDRTELFLTRAGLSNSAAKIVARGDVLVALYGANSGDVAIARIDGAINQAILCLKSKESNAFIYQFLSFKKDWVVATYLQGGQGNLSGEIVKSISVCFPSSDEQQRIASCLTSLDDLIVAQTQKIEVLKTHKKGLMQQLFPSPEATQGTKDVSPVQEEGA